MWRRFDLPTVRKRSAVLFVRGSLWWVPGRRTQETEPVKHELVHASGDVGLYDQELDFEHVLWTFQPVLSQDMRLGATLVTLLEEAPKPTSKELPV